MTTSRQTDSHIVSTALAGAVAMASAMGFGRFSFTPILPGMMIGLSLTSADAGLIAAGNFTGYLAGAVFSAYGWASGRERFVALSALLATALLQLAMGLSSAVWLLIAIRFLAGVASAFAMIFTSFIVLGHASMHADSRGSDHVPSVHFGGVGVGIALSSLVVVLLGALMGEGASTWRVEWFAGAAVSLVLLIVVWRLLPHGPPRSTQTASEPPLEWRLPLALATLSYGLFGFGYVITATFVVTMARMGDAGAWVEFLTWFLAGIAAAVSIYAWRPVMLRLGLAGVFVAGLVVQAAGVLASIALPLPYAPLVGGALLGATFMMITAYGLRIGRELSPASPRRALAFMTAAFGLGQIVGPLVAGVLAERTGGFTAPTVVAALVLLAAVLVFLPIYRRIP